MEYFFIGFYAYLIQNDLNIIRLSCFLLIKYKNECLNCSSEQEIASILSGADDFLFKPDLFLFKPDVILFDAEAFLFNAEAFKMKTGLF